MSRAEAPAPATVVARPRARRRIGIRDFLWITWRQHRALITTSTTVALVGVVAFFALESALRTVPACGSESGQPCAATPWQVTVAQAVLRALVLGGPVAVGAFWGAPAIAREYESGTHVVAWGQDVTPVRWLLSKTLVLVAVVGVLSAALAVSGARVSRSLLALRPDTTFASNFANVPFETTSLLLVVYCVVALVIGVAVGTGARRVVPAIAVTVAVVAALRLVVALALRGHFLSPVKAFSAIDSPGPVVPPNALVLVENAWSRSDGSVTAFSRECLAAADWQACLQDHGIAARVTIYQPPSRLVLFQWLEAGLLVAVAAVALLAAVWALSRRTSSR